MAFEFEWWEYTLIPIIAGIVGYGTNVVALHLTFYPLEFVGIELFRLRNQPWGLFGWQGIIPTKAEKMASITFDLMTKRLLSIQDLFSRLEPEKFAEAMDDVVLLMMDEVINEVANEFMPKTWNSIPKDVRDDIIVSADGESNKFLIAFMNDMQAHIEDVVDIKEMCISACVADKHLMVRLFQECGEQEFVFVKQSGFYFGFLFGLLQMVVWFFYPAGWILPVAGFAVGWVTNWMALKVIFKPVEPISICGYKLQGIFLQRQAEVADVFARVVCVDIMHIKAIWETVFTGKLSKNFSAMLRAHTLAFTDKLLVEVEPLAVAALGRNEFLKMKESIAQKVGQKLPDVIDTSFEYTQSALGMEETIREKLKVLPSREFEGVLHPAFEEDEIQLIILGGMLGGIVGVLQLFTLFR
eukprot:scaffold1727_cov133-Cylindrotheca_fusiformis.AAC.9